MLDAIKKKLGIVEAAIPDVASVDMEAFAKLQSDYDSLQAAFAEHATAAAEVAEKLVSATEVITQATAIVEQANLEKAAALAEVKAVKMAARKAVVVANIGEEKADAFLAATEMLEDTAFDAVTGALAGSMKAEAESVLFKEVGVEAKVDATAEAVTESAEMTILKKKYKAKPAK